MANEKLLNMSSRVDWKVDFRLYYKSKSQNILFQACATDKASETDMVKEFRKNFSPFDFTLE